MTSFENQHVYLSFLSLIFVTSEKQICVVHMFYTFRCSWISFPCLYLNNNHLILFYGICLANNLLYFKIWYKRCGICMILFFSLYELFPAFIFANNTGHLVNSLFGVKILIRFLSFISSSSLPSSVGKDGKSSDFFFCKKSIIIISLKSWSL